MADSDRYDNALDLWRFFNKEGGLDVERDAYDGPIVEDIQTNLGFSVDESLDLQLAQHEVSVERFIGALFTAIQPYALMMTDLLQMFEEAGAKTTNENLSICFDFGSEEIPRLEFDVENFRDWLETWERLRQLTPNRRWTPAHLWELRKRLRKWRANWFPDEETNGRSADSDPAPSNADARSWVSV